MGNTWPNGHRHAMTQREHENWNSRNYPGTLQLCTVCEQPTGRCEEGAIVNALGQPICEESSNAELCVGGRVRLLKSIYDDGEDHHPPGWIAHHGEVLRVKEVRGDVLAVAHEGNPGSFVIYPGEYETHNANVTGLAPAQETTK